ncbi:uncharacterized protein J4E88_000073 [Alternaria novae-zelandiae]|uniref:uncharacterized protein n=1 Tax=Alternaria novae-zelandiae TaxID=430562 RepID=UPI0020C2908A|nr:uncharacterized protein J4E88_000073 [Alternaria novae-zelandiae]KAI4695903.1 hypothetical protein J4E88_000073 [Alternaria novae-zelandiae]
MSITFGAVGDIISVALLAKDLIATLDEARGSKAEYRAAVQAIKTLNDTINLVNHHVIQQGVTTPELRNLCETSKQAVARCRILGDAFLARLRRYQTTFDKTHGANKIKEMAMAVRWRIGEKEALGQFHAEILGASLSLQTLLATANFSLLSVNRKEMNAKLDAAQVESHATILSQNTSLNVLADGVKNANSRIEAGNSILAKVSEALKFDRIRQLGAELKGLMRGVMAVNFATYRAVIRLESALPSHLERRLIEDPVILEDPIGRIAPVHLQFITSWDAFNAVLEGRFHDREGYKKMKQREYGLQIRKTGKEIEQSRPWQSAFSPGQHIEMSFVFNQDDVGESSSAICPGCRTPSSHSNDADIQCTECQMFFRRITVIQDDESPPRNTPSAEDQHTRDFVLQPELTEVGSRKRTFYEPAEREEEDLRSFKRYHAEVRQRAREPEQKYAEQAELDHLELLLILRQEAELETDQFRKLSLDRKGDTRMLDKLEGLLLGAEAREVETEGKKLAEQMEKDKLQRLLRAQAEEQRKLQA